MILRSVWVSLRPHQWTKNLLLFAAPALSKHLFEPDAMVAAVAAFVVFCALSGTVYIINDIADLERDRLHPHKRSRPIASGALPVGTATGAAIALGLSASAGAFAIGLPFLAWSLTYLGLNLAYSFKLKNIVIIDALSLSFGFVVRAVAGGAAVGVPISKWLLVCTILLALFLAFAKRRHELTSLEGVAAEHRSILSEYTPYLLDQMIAVVTASCVTAYSFYTLAEETRQKYQTDLLSLTIPFVLYGIFRYLYLVHRRDLGGSPSEILVTDRPLLFAVALWAIAIMTIVYVTPGPPVPLLE